MATGLTPTAGELLLLDRRRRGYNQVEAAAMYGVRPDRYRDWEADRRTTDQPKPRSRVGRLTLREQCFLLRRRAGKTQRELAEEIGLTRVWVHKMEEGSAPVARLCQFWGV